MRQRVKSGVPSIFSRAAMILAEGRHPEESEFPKELKGLLRKFDLLKDEHPRYKGDPMRFLGDIFQVVKNAEGEGDSIVPAVDFWFDACLREIGYD